MKKAVLSILVLTLILSTMPSVLYADATDDCPRVGRYIGQVQNLIERAAPAINRSGNERAINLLQTAVSEIRAANRAYGAGICRVAFHHAQLAQQAIIQAIRLIHHRGLD